MIAGDKAASPVEGVAVDERTFDVVGLVLLSCTIALLVVVASGVMRYANADSLLPALMSTQELTIFYWGQDRLANLLPLLAFPVRWEWWNYALQVAMISAAFFALIAAFAAHHLRHTRGVVSPRIVAIATFASGLLTVWVLRDVATYRFVFEQLYAASLLLTLGGAWLLVQRGRVGCAMGAVALVAAVMVNPSCLLFAPAAWLVQPPDASWRSPRPVIVTAILLGAFGLQTLAASTVDYPLGSLYGEFSPSKMWPNVDTVLSNTWAELMPRATIVVLLPTLAVLVWAGRTMSLRLRLTYIGAPAFGVVWLVVFSGNGWVEQNEFLPRYFFPIHAAGILVLTGAATELAASALDSRVSHVGVPRGPRWIAALVLANAVVAFGLVAWVRHVDIDVVRAVQDEVDATDDHDAQFVVGDYWTTWPAVIEARARGRDVYGVTSRSEPILDDVRDAVDRRLVLGEPIVLVCSNIETSACVQQFGDRTGRRWQLAEVVDDDPVVITVEPIG